MYIEVTNVIQLASDRVVHSKTSINFGSVIVTDSVYVIVGFVCEQNKGSFCIIPSIYCTCFCV